MPVLDRSAILSADDLPREEVEVPEWGGTVYVRALSGDERDRWEASMIDVQREGDKTKAIPKFDHIRSSLCARTICDEQGKRLFTDADVEELGAKSAAALDRVYSVAERLSGLSAQDIEELAEGLELAPPDSSPSD